MIGILLFVFLAICIVISFHVNGDIFSPVKFYFLFLFVYFASIFYDEQSLYVYLIYVFFMLLGLIFVFIEKSFVGDSNKFNFNKGDLPVSSGKILFFLWLLSLIPLGAQAYLISIMGGIEPYISSIQLRVTEWQGLGHIIFMRKIYPIINIVYFIIGVMYKVKNRRLWWFLFVFHFLALVFMGFLSGSRGGVLYGFLFIMIISHYYIKRISISKAFLSIVIFVVVAAFLGSIRNTFSYSSSEGVNLNHEGGSLSKMHLTRYGIIPLDIILDDEFTNLQHGVTFLSVVTNFVPRSIWPEKPDTGGVVITKFAKGTSYLGTSNYSPGIFAESVINFGYFYGALFSLLISTVVFLIVSYIYKKFIMIFCDQKYRVVNFYKAIFFSAFYLFVITIPGSLLFGEFTNLFMNLIMKIAPLFFICLCFKLLFKVGFYENDCD